MKSIKPRMIHGKNRMVPFGVFGLLSLFIVIGFQNCSPNIQVTDQSAKVDLLSQESPVVPEPPQPLVENAPPISQPMTNNPFTPGPGVILLPIQGEWASIAYEDNISSPEAGDRDYNDAVFNFRIAEQLNNNSQLNKIFIEVRLREHLSANSHILSLILDGNRKKFYENISFESAEAFRGAASIKVTDQDGEIVEFEDIYKKRIEVFSSTSGRVGDVIKIEITLLQPELNARSNGQTVDYKKYRFILANRGEEKMGIDIAEINSTDEMLSNGNNYPFGFMIPTNWQPPAERQLINSAYPHFDLYRNWLINGNGLAPTAEVLNWYLN